MYVQFSPCCGFRKPARHSAHDYTSLAVLLRNMYLVHFFGLGLLGILHVRGATRCHANVLKEQRRSVFVIDFVTVIQKDPRSNGLWIFSSGMEQYD